MGVFDPIAGFGVTFKTMFRKTFTEEYPNGPKVTAPRFHGRHQLNRWPDGLEKCVGCELCAWACPADAIYVEGAQNTDGERFSPGERYGRVYQINYLRCILCGLCIEACPTRALTMTNEFELADDSRAKLIYEKDDLLGPLLPGMELPPHERRLGDDEQAYFLGLPATGKPDDRAGDISGWTPPVPNQGIPGRKAGQGRERGRQAREGNMICRAPRSAVTSSARSRSSSRSVTTLDPIVELRSRGVSPRSLLHSREAPLVTGLPLVPLVTGAEVAFWLLAPVMILGALGMILSRKPVHSALCLAAVMISLAVQYAAQDAPFLFVVQIIVYTGAILMLFLFVLMLVGVDAADSLVETIRGQRVWAVIAGVGFGVLLVFAVGNAVVGSPLGLDAANSDHGGNVQGIAALVFTRYVFVFEATAALLITAALGAMVLAHRERLTPEEEAARAGRRADAEVRRDRSAPRTAAQPGRVRPAQRGRHPGPVAGRHRLGAVGVGDPAGAGHRGRRPRAGGPDRAHPARDRGTRRRGRRGERRLPQHGAIASRRRE